MGFNPFKPIKKIGEAVVKTVAAPIVKPFEVAKDVVTGNFKGIPEKLIPQPIRSAVGIGQSLDQQGESPQRDTSAQDAMNKALQDRLEKQKKYADTLSGESKSFRENLGAFKENQIGGATDLAKRALAEDLTGVKRNMNSRGLLYSGINNEEQNKSRSKRSVDLAKRITGINMGAESIAQDKEQLARAAQAGASEAELSNISYQAKQKEDAYSLALKQQQNESNFWGEIFGQGAGLVAKGLLAL